ncbi:MAG TPA: hypothetical protein VF433_03015 [Cellvibrio sp.]
MSKKENSFIVCSVGSLMAFLKLAEELWDKEKYVEFGWKIGPRSSMPQKALIHIWFRTWVAHLTRQRERDVTQKQINGMKHWVKKHYYLQTGADFMIDHEPDPYDPRQLRKTFSSIADWSPAECADVMTWMQATAANNGLILESMGEFQRLKQQQNG